MTDEEMAEESLISYRKEPKWEGKIFMQDENTSYKDGFLAGLAKGRNCLNCSNHDLRKRVLELEKEKYELLGIIQGKDKAIEKMKCCNNCKLYQCEKWKNNEINYHFNKCENWELAE